jgi:hypothetical protein
MQATGAGQIVPPVWVNNGWTAGPSLHFQKIATTTRISANVASLKLCAADPSSPPAEFAVDDVSLRLSGTQGAIPYPTVGCPATTTTPVATTTTTTTSGSTITTTPGGQVEHWDFARDGLAGWSPLSGTTLGTQPDPDGGTDLVVSGAGATGSGTTLTIDATTLRDDTWYDLVVDVRLPAGTKPVLFKIWANGSGGPAAVVSDSAWRPVIVHFRKRAGQTAITANVTVQADCSADQSYGPGTFLISGASLYQAVTQAEITYTTTGCPLVTTTTTTTSPTAMPVQCRVQYSESRWSGGYQGSIALTNTGSTTLSGWKLTFTLSNGQLQTAWPVGGFGQAGTLVTIIAPGWTPDLAPGQTVQLGFVASGTGSASDFRLNGVACSGSTATRTTSYDSNT